MNWCVEVGSEVEDEQYSEILLQNRQMKRVILVDWYGLILRVDCNRTVSVSVSVSFDDVVAAGEGIREYQGDRCGVKTTTCIRYQL